MGGQRVHSGPAPRLLSGLIATIVVLLASLATGCAGRGSSGIQVTVDRSEQIAISQLSVGTTHAQHSADSGGIRWRDRQRLDCCPPASSFRISTSTAGVQRIPSRIQVSTRGAHSIDVSH